jgi:AcrR family transcriptional regulator
LTQSNRRDLRLSTLPVPRADAAKNRDRILVEARKLFSTAAGTVSLEAIARKAGIGIGTLYRHFPTKEALVEAVYRSELDALDLEANELLLTHQGFNAMRQWMDSYAKFVATKHAMHDALRIALTARVGSPSETRARICEALAKFLAAGARDGSIRSGIRADDLTLSLAGSVFAATASADPAQIRRVLDLLMAGLRSSGPATGATAGSKSNKRSP